MSATNTALSRSTEKARSGSGWYAVVARTGLVAKGLSFGLVGALAIKLAIGSGGKATSREGALAQLSHHAFGKVALIALAIGFAAYALWRFVHAASRRRRPERVTERACAQVGGHGARLAGRPRHSRGRRARDRGSRPLEPLPWARDEVRRQVAHRRALARRPEVGHARRRRRPRRALRRLRPRRRLPREGCARLQAQGCDRDRRRAAEARARVVRAVPARDDGRRPGRVRAVLPRRREAARRQRLKSRAKSPRCSGGKTWSRTWSSVAWISGASRSGSSVRSSCGS